MWAPLIAYKRKGVPELIVYGAVSWVSDQRILHQYGGDAEIFGRSLVKPFQMKVLTKELDAVLSIPEKAISLASHNGEEKHVRIAQSIIDDANSSYLQTPESLPLVPKEGSKKEKNRWLHCCSGKHAAIIKGCLEKDWRVTDYISAKHLYHQEFIRRIQKYFGHHWQPRLTAQDGCNMPTVTFTMSQLAYLFSWLVVEKKQDWIWQAMTRYPDLIGGKDRLDTLILKSCKGFVLAKEGADGLLGLSIAHPDYPQGLGVVIKIAHGWDTRSMGHIARTILGTLGFSIESPPALNMQEAVVSREVFL